MAKRHILRSAILGCASLFTALLADPARAQDGAVAQLTIRADQPGPTIDRHIYGQFVEHLGRGVYEGVWVGESSSIPNTRGIRNDVVAALKAIKVPVVRWPGGCFADDYHWRDGIGPRDKRPVGINGSWGGVPETHAFGTHEFMDFAQMIGADPYVGVNVGTGSIQEAQAWMQYMTAAPTTAPGAERARNGRVAPWKVPYVGIGNESWGCGGNMLADDYANQFRRYTPFIRDYGGGSASLIAVGPDTDDYDWTEKVMARAMRWRTEATPLMFNKTTPIMQGLALHFYTVPTNDFRAKGPAVAFDEDVWIATLKRALFMDELIRKHGAIMDRYDPDKTVALIVDEWGTWYDRDPNGPDGLYQQNTLRDALVAAATLNIFQNHADRVRMANIAQMVNVLQAMILTDKDKMVLTPTYHVFDLYKVHQDAKRLAVALSAPAYRRGDLEIPGVSASASLDAAGKIHVSLVNFNPIRATRVTARIEGVKPGQITGRVLTAKTMDARNTFSAPDALKPAPFDGARLEGDQIVLDLPAKSIVVLELGARG